MPIWKTAGITAGVGLAALGSFIAISELIEPSGYSVPPAQAEQATPQAEAIADYSAAIKVVPGVPAYVAGVRPGLVKNLVEIEVTPAFEAQAKADRSALAAALWEAWVNASGVNDVDKARIRLVNGSGKEIGGSRAIAGSVLYVAD